MNILVTSRSFAKTNSEAWERLEANGFSLRRCAGNPTPATLAREVDDIDVLIIGNDTVNSVVMDAAPALKLVHMHGTGLDGIDIEYATSRGILVANAPGANVNAVAEMTLAMMLNAARGIGKHARLLRAGTWQRTPGREVSSSIVGIVGLGNIGRRVAELLRGFRPKLIAFDAFTDQVWAEANGIEMVASVDELIIQADFVVLTLPLTHQTKHMVNDRTLGLMKKDAFIVNSARGGLVDDAALVRAVEEGRIAGAALDVFAQEPLPLDSPLRRPEDIEITPHLAASSRESAARVSAIVADNVIAIIKKGQRDIAVNFKG
ncbi:MAG: phosphoglycerate dehydrogenase [Planctomycetaceae bacterium]|nr:phosphoglycerate dehydrogenase [Planctomycetaceae bacterium]